MAEEKLTIEQMHQEVRDAEQRIEEAKSKLEHAKRRLGHSLAQCGAVPKEKIRQPKPPKPGRKQPSLTFHLLIAVVSCLALVFSLVAPFSPPTQLSVSMLVVMALGAGLICSVIILSCAAALLALYLAARGPAQQQIMDYPYSWFTDEQAKTPLEANNSVDRKQQEVAEDYLNQLLQEQREAYRDPNFDLGQGR